MNKVRLDKISLLSLVSLLGWLMLAAPWNKPETQDAETHRKPAGNLQAKRTATKPIVLTIVERGKLEADRSNDIYCRVKANTINATWIKKVIDDGARDSNGPVVVDLDDSNLKQQLKSQATETPAKKDKQ